MVPTGVLTISYCDLDFSYPPFCGAHVDFFPLLHCLPLLHAESMRSLSFRCHVERCGEKKKEQKAKKKKEKQQQMIGTLVTSALSFEGMFPTSLISSHSFYEVSLLSPTIVIHDISCGASNRIFPSHWYSRSGRAGFWVYGCLILNMHEGKRWLPSLRPLRSSRILMAKLYMCVYQAVNISVKLHLLSWGPRADASLLGSLLLMHCRSLCEMATVLTRGGGCGGAGQN